MRKIGYAELHCLTNFSFQRGASHPEELVKQAIELNYSGLAITDECSVAGIVRAYSVARAYEAPKKQSSQVACGNDEKNQQRTALVQRASDSSGGDEIPVSQALTEETSFNSHLDDGSEVRNRTNFSLITGAEFSVHNPWCSSQLTLVLLVTNRDAYAELCQLITKSRMRCEKSQYYTDVTDIESIIKSCLVLWKPFYDEPDIPIAQWLQDNFREQSWIMYERTICPQEFHFKTYIAGLSARYFLPVVCTGNVHFHCRERKPLQDVLTAIRYHTTVEHAGELLDANHEKSMRSLEKIARLFPEEWIAETQHIQQRCQFSLSELKYDYPTELVPDGKTASEYLTDLVREGEKRRFPHGVPSRIRQIIEKELTLITEESYEYFFLTIYDIVTFAQQEGILYQGRGSAANSVVCYCLGITAVDPEKVDVLFERFISKERSEPPDIDVDFEHERREEIIQYIYRKYGRKHAALAAAVISYRFKSAVRDVGKALGYSEEYLSYLLSNIDRRDKATSWHQQLKKLSFDDTCAKGRYFIQLVDEIRGFPRHLSQHVGGFIISSRPLSELVPTENTAMPGRSVIQWDKDDLESLGLLKVDILALGMLTAIRKCFDLIKLHRRQPMSLHHVEWDDPAVYKMLQKGDSVGVFQIESRAQTSMLPRLKPACYYDLVVQIAIVRPGPIQGDMVHPYLRRRKGLEIVTYPSEAVERVLKRTLGVPVFQEQVIQLAMVAAGFSGGEADQLRRSMASWKRNGELNQFEPKLIDGMMQRGYTREYAQRIFHQICGFGEYGFPESHSASFALLCYVSAWLKCHYPAEFCCALLNSQPMGFYSPSQLIQDAKRHQVTILPIDVNKSDWDHSLEPVESPNVARPFAVRLGFRLIKGVSRHAIERLLSRRPDKGFEYLDQITQCELAKNDLAALASADALASLAGHRYQARWELAGVSDDGPLFSRENMASVEVNSIDVRDKETAGLSLNDGRAKIYSHRKATEHDVDKSGGEQLTLLPPEETENMLEDYASTGITLGTHPLALLRARGYLDDCQTAVSLDDARHQSVINICGIVTGRQRPGTAKDVTFLTLEDETGNVNVVVWSGTAREQRQAFLTSSVLKVKGVLERQDGVTHVIAGRLTNVSHWLESLSTRSRDFR